MLSVLPPDTAAYPGDPDPARITEISAGKIVLSLMVIVRFYRVL
jgi:hypothetical protein